MRFLFAGFLFPLLAGCIMTPPAEPVSSRMVNQPYNVFGACAYQALASQTTALKVVELTAVKTMRIVLEADGIRSMEMVITETAPGQSRVQVHSNPTLIHGQAGYSAWAWEHIQSCDRR